MAHGSCLEARGWFGWFSDMLVGLFGTFPDILVGTLAGTLVGMSHANTGCWGGLGQQGGLRMTKKGIRRQQKCLIL